MSKLFLNKALSGALVMSAAMTGVSAYSAPTQEEMWDLIQKQEKEIEALKKQQQETDEKVEAAADAIDSGSAGGSKASEWAAKTKLGGYAEHHYNNFDESNDKIDAHRFVLFIGHEFNKKVRMFSEFELEHSLAGDGKPGEVELEQAYVEWDYTEGHNLKAGLFLVPVGILNETHEPETFYGVERNNVEKNIIPTTWWETGVMFSGSFAPGWSYDVALHSGLDTTGEDADGNVTESLGIRGGRQKSAEAIANDVAYTARVKYTGVPGLEWSASYQWQEDLSQGLGDDSLDSATATLFETHVIYETGPFEIRALYAQWDIDADYADTVAAGRDEQTGWYIEPSYKITDNFGVFVRMSEWNNAAGTPSSDANEVIDYGVNYWLTPRVVFKADYQDASDYNDNDSINLGVGWSF